MLFGFVPFGFEALGFETFGFETFGFEALSFAAFAFVHGHRASDISGGVNPSAFDPVSRGFARVIAMPVAVKSVGWGLQGGRMRVISYPDWRIIAHQ